MEDTQAKELDMFLVLEEHVETVLPAKQLFEMSDGEVEVQNIFMTLHPFHQKLVQNLKSTKKGLRELPLSP